MRKATRKVTPAPAPEQQQQPRYGELGHCRGCGGYVNNHFDSVGRWVGCTAVPEGTTFVLTPSATSSWTLTDRDRAVLRCLGISAE